MRITVFGSTGRTGRLVLTEGLRRGHLNRLTDQPAQGGVCTSRGLFDKPSGMTRADAAAILLDIIEDGTTVKTAINTAGRAKR